MSHIESVDEYPIPFGLEEIIELQEDALDDEMSRIDDEYHIIRSVDEFHDRYIDEMVRTDEWVFFRNRWSHSDYIYVWCHAGGYGFRFNGDWEVACSLIDAWDEFTDVYDSSDFEPTRYPWELP